MCCRLPLKLFDVCKERVFILLFCFIGCCCIDEFDKMGSQHQALLEAMV